MTATEKPFRVMFEPIHDEDGWSLTEVAFGATGLTIKNEVGEYITLPIESVEKLESAFHYYRFGPNKESLHDSD